MYNEEKDDLKIWLLNNITDLLVDENTKSEERKVLLNAKHQLENSESANYVCNLVRVGLDPLSWQSKLSNGVMKFHQAIVSDARPVSHQAGALGGAALGLAFSSIGRR
ncbi:bacteriocin immunity protein [Lactobacillus amylovorus]|uniref:bacteriocin immunity protein n=1 Tax=Lactobacillus amylovorus TaxID=1604 RepID=UPI0021C8B55A|nr:bacteriocin immunity protein [Lactobacillus amylovorus]UXN12041.1 bacteriocin immunity protein [Lactobacillus amylovorus]